MYRCMCRCKVKGGRVTDKNLYYEGSITIDAKILSSAGILPGEMVNVLNLNSGVRISTYVIEGKENSGTLCLNGPAARHFEKGDEIIILGISFAEESEIAEKWRMKIVELDDNNRIKFENR
ncbi:MAG: aspartate 1-decarboxylase [Candidatus Omnitrophica bacterium]|nr:aspartate 1-decarboxylase [Candidatus Omnitrophota bacterium]